MKKGECVKRVSYLCKWGPAMRVAWCLTEQAKRASAYRL